MINFFLRDVGITQNQFNAGQQLLSAGIIILEARVIDRPKKSQFGDS